MSIELKKVVLRLVGTFAVIALAACSGGNAQSSGGNTVIIGDFDTDIEATPDLADVIDDLPDGQGLVATADNVRAAFFTNSGLIRLPRALVSDDLNSPGEIRNLLLLALGDDFAEAENWTFRLLTGTDFTSNVLRQGFGLFVPIGGPDAIIVVGDEVALLDFLFGLLEIDTTPTTDIVGGAVTSTVSVSATGGTN